MVCRTWLTEVHLNEGTVSTFFLVTIILSYDDIVVSRYCQSASYEIEDYRPNWPNGSENYTLFVFKTASDTRLGEVPPEIWTACVGSPTINESSEDL